MREAVDDVQLAQRPLSPLLILVSLEAMLCYADCSAHGSRMQLALTDGTVGEPLEEDAAAVKG
eukprot:1500111-Amphidinium_carterae.2